MLVDTADLNFLFGHLSSTQTYCEYDLAALCGQPYSHCLIETNIEETLIDGKSISVVSVAVDRYGSPLVSTTSGTYEAAVPCPPVCDNKCTEIDAIPLRDFECISCESSSSYMELAPLITSFPDTKFDLTGYLKSLTHESDIAKLKKFATINSKLSHSLRIEIQKIQSRLTAVEAKLKL